MTPEWSRFGAYGERSHGDAISLKKGIGNRRAGVARSCRSLLTTSRARRQPLTGHHAARTSRARRFTASMVNGAPFFLKFQCEVADRAIGRC
jgi:hypothetical protein